MRSFKATMIMETTILFYEMQSGKSPFLQWLNDLKDIRGRAIVRARLERVKLGNLGNTKNIGDGVSELKIPYGPGYRVSFGQEGPKIIVLLCGGDKTSQKRDILKAKLLWGEYISASKKLPR